MKYKEKSKNLIGRDIGEVKYINQGEILQLRTSLLKTYLRCPAQCFFRYFKGLIVMPKSFIIMGTCSHLAGEHANRYKLKKGKNEKLSNLQDVFHESFKKRIKSTKWTKDEKPDKIEAEGIKQVIPTYHECVHKKVEPLYIEEPFKLEIKEENLIITGSLDLVEESHLIRDLKIKSRTPNWMEVFKSFQGKSYLAGYKYKFKKNPRGFVLDCIIRKNIRAEYLETKTVKPSEESTDEFKQTAIRIARNIRAGCFYPNREGNYFCSPNACGYWGICNKGAWKNLGVFTRVFGENSDVERGDED